MIQDVNAFIRGAQSENNTRIVLSALVDEGTVLNFRQTAPNSIDDQTGIDFYFAILINGKRVEIPLQVKSSDSGIKKHNAFDGGSIPAVNGQASDLRSQISRIIDDYKASLSNGEETMRQFKVAINGVVPIFEAEPRDGINYVDLADIHGEFGYQVNYSTWASKYTRKLNFYQGKDYHQVRGFEVGSIRRWAFMTSVKNALAILDSLEKSKSGVFQFLQKYKGVLSAEVDLKRHPHIEEEQTQMAVLAPVKEIDVQVDIVEGKPLTSSKNVAEVFGKEHKNVLRDIQNLDCSEEFARLNFELSSYIDSTGRSLPMYLMTQDGWAYLVMGFTGPKAGQFKESYIKKFNDLKQKAVQPLALSGDIAEMLLLAGTQLKEKQAKIQFLEEEKKVLAEEATKQLVENVALAQEVAAAEQMLRVGKAKAITDAVNEISRPWAYISRNQMFNALSEKGFIRRKRDTEGRLRWFPYAQYSTELRPYFIVTPDFVDRKGKVHDGQMHITPIGLLKTYPAVCDALKINMDSAVLEQLRHKAEEYQRVLKAEETPEAV